MVRDKLKSFENKLVGRSSSVGAVLLDRHAEIIARKMRAITGKPFTAMDYYRTWVALRYGTGTDGFAQKEIRLQEEAVRVQLGRDIAISHAMLWKVLREKEVKGKSHGHALEMTPEIMKELPRALADPIMILRNRKGDDPNAPILPDEIVAVVDLQDKNGSTAIIPIVLKERNGKYMLKTFFGKDDPTWFQKRMMLGDVLYAHKKRALDWVKAIQRHKAPGRFTLQDSFFNSISTDTNLVKERVDNEEFYQSAWHGSPYDFREFLLEMIGAGEGRQAHGWGLYFAQNREVSERYKEWLKKAIHTLTYDGKSLNEQPPDVQGALRGFENYYLDLLKGIQNALDAFAALYPNGVDAQTRIGDVRVNRRSIKDSLTHFMYPAKFDTVTSLLEGLEIAAYIDSIPDVDGKDIMNHFLVYPIMYGGEKNTSFVA